MARLVLGVLIWSVVHIFPSVAPGLRSKILKRFGENAYKGVFALLMVVAIYLIISGWKSAVPAEIFTPADWSSYAAALLTLVGFILFLGPYPDNNFKRMLRHPQLVGMACFGAGHLLATGDSRSIVLFGGLTAWSVIEIFLLNRRDRDWEKPQRVSLKNDLGLVLFGVLVYLAFLFTHHLLFGGSPLT